MKEIANDLKLNIIKVRILLRTMYGKYIDWSGFNYKKGSHSLFRLGFYEIIVDNVKNKMYICL